MIASNILLIERIFPKYRKDILDKLHQKINFILLHSSDKSGVKQVGAPYSKKIRSIRYSGNETHQFLNVFPYIVKKRPEVVIHDFSIGIASLVPTFFLVKLLGKKFILWGHGYDRTKDFYPGKSLRDKLRLFLIKKADAVILYGQEAKSKISQYVNPDKLFVAYNCLNTEVLSKIRNDLEREGHENIKKRIGFNYKYNLIYIGRILKSKKPELLIDIYENLKYKYKDSLCIHYIGDGDYLNQIKQIVDKKGCEENIKFYGPVNDDIKNGEFLYCSDLMIIPGYVGLAVNHAFNFDCPVMTLQQKIDGPFHSPEIEYLINNKTGYIVETHTANEMALIIDKHLDNKETQSQMKLNIREMIESTCSIDNFIKGFKDAIKFVLKEKQIPVK